MIYDPVTGDECRIIARYGSYRPAWSDHTYNVALCQFADNGKCFVEFAVVLHAKPCRLEIFDALDAARLIYPDLLFIDFALRQNLHLYNSELGQAFKNVRELK